VSAIKGKTVAETEQLWHDASDGDLEPLLATPWPGTWQAARARVEALAKRKPDPRLTAALAKLLEDMPWVAMASISLWRLVIGLLVKSRDPRAMAVLLKLEQKGTTYYRPPVMTANIRSAIARLRQAGVKPAALPPPEPVAPEADAARQVHADALVEKGDPRGEFILLQSAPTTRASLARQRALLKQHERAWLGGLAGLVRSGTTEWEGGNPVVITLQSKPNVIKRAHGEPALATVRRLRFVNHAHTKIPELAVLLTDPVLARVRAIHRLPGLNLDELVTLTQGKLPPVEDIFCEYLDGVHDRLHEWIPTLTGLGSIYRWGQGPEAELLEAPLWQRLERVTIVLPRDGVAAWVDAIRRHRPSALHAIRVLPAVEEDRGSMTIDLATGVVDLAIDRFDLLVMIPTDRVQVKTLRARSVRGAALDLAELERTAKRLGATLETAP
jgi:hypothetical protein